jgi:GNAT superfamily N-acetyltransferase
MQIKCILHKELEDFINSPLYQNSPFLPISKHRAISHVHNPRALADDLVLVVIYEEEELVAYLGVLPDDLFFNDQKEHAGWLSCMWVDPKMRGKGLAKKLIHTVFEAWNYRILVTEFTPAAKGLYDRTQQFLDLAKPKGLRGYRRFALAELLPAKNPEKWKRFQGLLKLADGTGNIFNSIRLALQKQSKVQFNQIEQLDEEAWQLVKKFRSPNELMSREKEALNWILQYPWLINSPANEESKRYHFSSVANKFSFIPLKIYNSKSIAIGFIILSVRDGKMKTPYAYFDPKEVKIVAKVIEQQMASHQIHTFTTFQPQLVEYWKQNKGSFWMRKDQQRHYIISKVFENQLKGVETLSIQDGDADAAFT